MKDKLHRLFLLDRRTRFAMYGTATVVSIAFGAGALASGSSLDESAFNMELLGFVVVLSWTLIYCAFSDSPARLQTLRDSASVTRRAAWAGTLAALAAIFGISTSKIEAAVMGRRLTKIAAQPPTPENLLQVREVLQAAASNRVKIAAAVVNEVHGKLNAASYQPSLIAEAAWGSLLQLARYQSTQSPAIVPRFPAGGMQPLATAYPNWKTEFDSRRRNNTDATGVTLWGAGMLEALKAAQLIRIGSDVNEGKPFGPNLIRVIGLNPPAQLPVDVILDGLHCKSVIFERVRLVYTGGAIDLRNVYTVDCDFEISRSINGRRLMEPLLRLEPINLTIF